ncbi:hypothetical protein WG909_08195 [Peptostreptococcaceae bacterium AGR-M142]
MCEFGIIEEFKEDEEYFYEPQKYNCISINDDILNDWWDELSLIQTYFNSYGEVNWGLNRWGTTIIPPKSLDAFYEIVSKDKKSKTSNDLNELMILLRTAISKNKYIIHFGV